MKVPDGNQPPPAQPGKPGAEPARTTAGSSGEAASLRAAGQLLDRLKLDNQQAVLARVTQVLNRQQGLADQVLLEVRGRSLLVQPPAARAGSEPSLQVGDLVRVMRAGNELQLLDKLGQTPEARISRALAQHLPWQQRLDTGLAQLMAALPTPTPGASPAGQSPSPLPAAAVEAIQQLISRLPSASLFKAPLTPAPPPASPLLQQSGNQSGIQSGNQSGGQPNSLAPMIKAWITESGLFAESRLVRSPEPALQDLKLALGRIVTTLLARQDNDALTFNHFRPLASHELVQAPLQFPNQMPPPQSPAKPEAMTVGQTLRILAGMLNRISVNQLHSQTLTNRATADAPAPATWLLELPWLTPQNEPRLAQLRLERHDPEEEGADNKRKSTRVAEWRFSLALDLDKSGPVFFEVSLKDLEVSARVWAEKQSTLSQARTDLNSLRSRLTDLGLQVTDLECRQGSPRGTTTRLEQRLVDTRA